jgi:hypothetical protein
MGNKTRTPPPPNFQPLADASLEASRIAAAASKEQLDWAKEQYRQDREISDKVIADAMRRQDENDVIARKDRQRYEQIFQPLEEDLVQDAEGYTDERNRARAEAAAGRAAADVSQQFALARTAAQDRLESFGIDPSQTRAGALDVSARIAEAAARAGAANTTREGKLAQEEAIGRTLRSEAISIGRGYPGQVATAYGTALQSGTAGVNTGLATTASGANTMGTGAQWAGISSSALGTAGNIMNQGYQNQLAYNKAKQEQSSGWGQALGAIAGIGMGIAMPGIQSAFSGWMNKPRASYAEGGVVIDTGDAPAHQGVPVTAQMSPTQGAAVDDVSARLNVDEFVIPADVLKWKGEEFFQRTIETSRKKKQEAPAKPTVMMEGVPITPQGNPAREALPLR